MSDIVMHSELERLLTEAKAAARRGDKATARTLLTRLVERDPQNEQAWMWLSGVVSDPEEQQICLENVLVINPANDKARKGLEYLRTKNGSAITPTMPTPTPQPATHDPNLAAAIALTPDSGVGGYAPQPPIPAPAAQAEVGHGDYDGHDYGYAEQQAHDGGQGDSLASIFADWPSSPAPSSHQFEAFPPEPFATTAPPPASGPFSQPADMVQPGDAAQSSDPMPYYPSGAYEVQWDQGGQFNRSDLAEAAGAIIDSWASGSANANAGTSQVASSDIWGDSASASGGWAAADADSWNPDMPDWSAADSMASAQEWPSPQASTEYQVPADPYAGFDMDHQGGAGQQYTPAPGTGQPGYTDEAFSDLEPFSFDMSINAEVESNTSTLYQGPPAAEQAQPYPDMRAGQHQQFSQQAQQSPALQPASPAPPTPPAGPPAWALPDSTHMPSAHQAQVEPPFYQAVEDQAHGQGYETMGDVTHGHGMPVHPVPGALAHDPFAGMLMGGGPAGPAGPAMPVGPMGPYMANDLPAPTELPGYRDPAAQPPEAAQPWYLQIGESPMGSQTHAGEGYPDGMMSGGSVVEQPRKVVPTIPCPNCHEQVPETSLACPQCRYSFFVNCPHCHELVDTSEARPNNPEPCPYCGTTIDKMALGMAGVTGAIPYESVPLSKDGQQYPAMLSGTPEMPAGRGLSFGWLVDLLWLAAIIAMVWALTQLPTWLNLPGQY